MRKILLVLCLFVFAAAGFAEEGKIFVTGKGSAQIKPDTVMIEAGAVTEGLTAAACNFRNREIMDSVYKKLKTFGLEDKDIKTITYSLSPKYTYDKDNRENRIAGYTLTHIFSVKLKDTKKAGELTDAIIAAGATKINGIYFKVEDEEKYKSQVRKEAVKDARKKADELASSAGVAIKGIVSLQESEQPIFYARRSFEGAMAMNAQAAAPTPVMEGETEISTTVNITYSIKD